MLLTVGNITTYSSVLYKNKNKIHKLKFKEIIHFTVKKNKSNSFVIYTDLLLGF